MITERVPRGQARRPWLARSVAADSAAADASAAGSSSRKNKVPVQATLVGTKRKAAEQESVRSRLSTPAASAPTADAARMARCCFACRISSADIRPHLQDRSQTVEPYALYHRLENMTGNGFS